MRKRRRTALAWGFLRMLKVGPVWGIAGQQAEAAKKVGIVAATLHMWQGHRCTYESPSHVLCTANNTARSKRKHSFFARTRSQVSERRGELAQAPSSLLLLCPYTEELKKRVRTTLKHANHFQLRSDQAAPGRVKGLNI